MHPSWLVVGLMMLTGPVSAGPVSEIEVTPDPIKNGQQIFTVRFTPSQTYTYDKLVFDCTYHQEFPSQSSHQLGGKKVIEPAAFTYRARDVKMVDSLDCNISFRVPIDMAKLIETHGQHAFNTNYPATISKIKVTATDREVALWSYELKPEGLHEYPEPSSTNKTVR